MSLDIELIGSALPAERVCALAELAAASAGIDEAHLAIEFVDAERIAELNERHRGKAEPTEVFAPVGPVATPAPDDQISGSRF